MSCQLWISSVCSFLFSSVQTMVFGYMHKQFLIYVHAELSSCFPTERSQRTEFENFSQMSKTLSADHTHFSEYHIYYTSRQHRNTVCCCTQIWYLVKIDGIESDLSHSVLWTSLLTESFCSYMFMVNDTMIYN